MSDIAAHPTRRMDVEYWLHRDELLAALELLKQGWARTEAIARPPLVLRLLGARPRYCLAGAIAQVRWGEPFRYSELEGDPVVRLLGFPRLRDLVWWNDTQSDAAPVLKRVERAAYGVG